MDGNFDHDEERFLKLGILMLPKKETKAVDNEVYILGHILDTPWNVNFISCGHLKLIQHIILTIHNMIPRKFQ